MKKFTTLLLSVFLIMQFTATAQTWSVTKRLTWNSGASRAPSLDIVSSSGIHVVWSDDTAGNSEIYYKSSIDSGSSWSPLQRLTWNSGESNSPVICSDSAGRLHVFWFDDSTSNSEIYHKSSSDGGSTWTALTRFTWNLGESVWPSVSSDSAGSLYTVWADNSPGHSEIYYKQSTDNGASWSALNRLTWNSGGSYTPVITAHSVYGIHLVWADDSPGNQEIFYKNTMDNGSTWSAPQRLTWNSGTSESASIAMDASGRIYVFWDDDSPGNREIYYKQSSDSGTTWSALGRLTWNPDWSGSPTANADSLNGIHIIWQDETPGNFEIYYKNSTNSGMTWSAVTRLTWNSGWSGGPSLIVDSSNGLHTVWYDQTPGNFEIFYKNKK